MLGLHRPTAGWAKVFKQTMSPNAADVTRPNCRVLHRPADAATGANDEIWDPMPATETVRRVLPPEEHQTDTEQLLAA